MTAPVSPTPTPAAPVLEMRGVTVAAPNDPTALVLEDVNWTVSPGEYWAVGGLARSGKTHFLAVAAGLQRPLQGRCRLFGIDLLSGPDARESGLRRLVGFVFDGGQLLHHLTLADNVALPLRYHHAEGDPDPAARIDQLIGLTGLEPWAGRFPTDVSRNWQQRFGLARALALRPELLFLDDPLSGLDPREAAWWIETMAALEAGHPLLNGRPLTLVVTSNDLRPWRRSARQFAVLQDKSFISLGEAPLLDTHAQPVLTDLLRPWHT